MRYTALALPAAVFALFVVVLPFLAVPHVGIPADMQKGMLMLGVLGICLCGAAFFSWRSQILPRVPQGVLPLLIVACISALASIRFAGIVGDAAELGTVASIVLFCAAAYAGSILSEEARLMLAHVLVAAAASAGAGACVLVFFYGASFADVFASHTQLSFSLCAALACAAVLADRRESFNRIWLCFAAFILSLEILVFCSIPAVVLLIAVLAVSVLESLWKQRAARIPYAQIIVLIFCGLLLFRGGTSLFALQGDVRPSPLSTEFVVGGVLVETPGSALWGVGPASFTDAWQHYRPQAFNSSPFWDSTFSQGYSTALTFAAELGALGACALIYLLLLFAYRWTDSLIEMKSILVLGTFSTLSLFFYSIELPLFLLAALALGCLASTTVSDKSLVLRGNTLRVIVVVLCLIAGVSCVYVATLQWRAAYLYEQGEAVQQAENVVSAPELLAAAAAAWPSALYADEAARAYIIEGEKESATGSTSEAAASFSRSLKNAQDAVAHDPEDGEAWLLSGAAELYSSSGQSSPQSLDIMHKLSVAASLFPTNPEIPYYRALAAAESGDTASARSYIAQALFLKPDYAPALALHQQLGE